MSDNSPSPFDKIGQELVAKKAAEVSLNPPPPIKGQADVDVLEEDPVISEVKGKKQEVKTEKKEVKKGREVKDDTVVTEPIEKEALPVDQEITAQEKAIEDMIFGEDTPKEEVIAEGKKSDNKEGNKEGKKEGHKEKKQDEPDYRKIVEEVSQDPFIDAYFKYKQSGKQDIAGFIQAIGIGDANKMELEDFIRIEAESLGTSPDEIDDVISEELDQFTSMTFLQKKKKLTEYREQFNKNQAERLKKFSFEQSEESARLSKLGETSLSVLDAKVSDLVSESKEYTSSNGQKGQLWKGGLLIEEPMAEDISKLAKTIMFSLQLTDDSGKIIGVDSEAATEMAIWHLYGKQYRKNLWNTAQAVQSKKLLKERHRPSENSLPTGAVVKGQSNPEDNLKSYKEMVRSL